jgi:hypothetical protein
MECRTCHHEHPKNEADEDGRPYSDPNFCIARLSERLQHNKEVADQAMKDREAAIVERDALRAQVLSNCVQNLPADSTLVKTEYWEAMKLQIEEWRKNGKALCEDIKESLRQEGLEASDTPASHYSNAFNRLLELLRG